MKIDQLSFNKELDFFSEEKKLLNNLDSLLLDIKSLSNETKDISKRNKSIIELSKKLIEFKNTTNNLKELFLSNNINMEKNIESFIEDNINWVDYLVSRCNSYLKQS